MMFSFVTLMALTAVPSLLSFGGAPVLQRCKCGRGLAAGTGALPVQSWNWAERWWGGKINQEARSVWEICSYLGWEVCSTGETDHGECLHLPLPMVWNNSQHHQPDLCLLAGCWSTSANHPEPEVSCFQPYWKTLSGWFELNNLEGKSLNDKWPEESAGAVSGLGVGWPRTKFQSWAVCSSPLLHWLSSKREGGFWVKRPRSKHFKLFLVTDDSGGKGTVTVMFVVTAPVQLSLRKTQ